MQAERIIDRKHPEYLEHEKHWMFLLDSWEGGDSYRNAIYGNDVEGYPVRNLRRHKREYGDPKEKAFAGLTSDRAATSDNYELRRARTPVPTVVRDALERHQSAIYAQEIKRSANTQITTWWKDVNGKGITIGDWMRDTIAPMLFLFGQLDLVFDHPRADDPTSVNSRADQVSQGLDRCIGSYILPMNMPWWKLDQYGVYTECLVREVTDDGIYFRHWEVGRSTLYDSNNEMVGQPLENSYGVIPIARLFDRRNPRHNNIGLPLYGPLAEIQRELYNRQSEAIIGDTMQVHCVVQGPEDYMNADGTIPMGPNWLLPMKKYEAAGGGYAYAEFKVLTFPKDGADSLRQNIAGLIDDADRTALLTKPAGAKGTTGKTVGQSGISKRLDSNEANKLLSRIAKVLDRVETQIGYMAYVVLTDGAAKPADKDAIKVSYPTNFDLFSPEELAMIAAEFQAIIAAVGDVPETEAAILKKLIRMILMGLDDDEYKILDHEIDDFCQRAVESKQQMAKIARMPPEPPPEPPDQAQVPGVPDANPKVPQAETPKPQVAA